jgi:hypothetical protein
MKTNGRDVIERLPKKGGDSKIPSILLKSLTTCQVLSKMKCLQINYLLQ